KKDLRNWLAINLLLRKLGRIGANPGVRQRAMRIGLSRLGSTLDWAIGSKLVGRKRSGAGINPALTVSAALGAGAGLLYLFDADRGACPRAGLRDGVTPVIIRTRMAARTAFRP